MAKPDSSSSEFTATAFMCVFNEADILAWTLQHLYDQGVGVYVIDNWSTDASPEIARAFPLVGFERFPVNHPLPYYPWRALLERVEALAAESAADWCIHHDADEIRRSSRPEESLAEALWRVDAEGYSAVDHTVLQFEPTDDLYRGDPERHFTRSVAPAVDGRLPHIKAWRNSGQRVDLASSGGHTAEFPGRRVYPEKFLLKHYPIRTSEQGARKVLQERIPRYDPAERAMRWHTQYDLLAETKDWVKCTEA